MKTLLHSMAFSASICIPLFVAIFLVIWIDPSRNTNEVLTAGKVFWFTGLLFVITNAVGFLFGTPWHQDKENSTAFSDWDKKYRLVIAYVSRGNNAQALERAIAATKLILETQGVRYEIEAITDMPVDVGADTYYLVPKDYQTTHKAKYKARALHYAAEHRPVSKNTWILHLDEESVVTDQLIHGINRFLFMTRDILTIGQGEIKYNAHNYGKHWLITAIDSIRTGDDLGRFRTQYKLFGKPLFGMHGSFFIVNSLVERKVGFDLGGKGSITEDAYFALVCADRGVRFAWVDGHIREQSPFTLLELLKQRRRWITGLRLLMWDKTISRHQRIMLFVNMTLWRIAWVGPVVTLANLLLGGSLLPFWAEYLAALTSGMVAAVYMVGAYRNVTDIGMNPLRQVAIWVSSGILMPLSCAIEGLAVLYSIVQPGKEQFDVVNKN